MSRSGRWRVPGSANTVQPGYLPQAIRPDKSYGRDGSNGRPFRTPTGVSLPSDQPTESVQYRDFMIMWAKDMSRSIDYLETRPDIDIERLAYYGVSMGARLGPLMLVVEPRIKTGILYVAGLKFQRALPEADPFNFVPRVTVPVLMIGARYDFFFPLESSQRPLFEMLGTPEPHKRWVIYDGGHSVPRNKLIAEALGWLDDYLGPVSLKGEEPAGP